MKAVLGWLAVLLLPLTMGGISFYWLVDTGKLFSDGTGIEGPRVSSGRQLSQEDTQALMEAEFPTYWVGEEYQGLELRHVSRDRFNLDATLPEPPTNAVQLIYGECILGGGSEGGDGPTCVPPLQIRTEAYCTRRPEFLAAGAKDGDEFEVRGADAQWLSVTDFAHLVLYTGDVTITVMAEDRTIALAVANELRPWEPGLAAGTYNGQLGPPTAECQGP